MIVISFTTGKTSKSQKSRGCNRQYSLHASLSLSLISIIFVKTFASIVASFVVVVVGFWGGGGCYVLFEKDFFLFFLSFFLDGKSVMSALYSYYYMCMFV